MPSVKKSAPSNWPPYPPPNESDEDRAARLENELQAKRVSDTIDRDIGTEREQWKRRSQSAKVLLLGQAESGKSTILKNFQLHFAPKAFAAEIEVWRPVIHLNLVRSVNCILNILTAKEQNTREPNSLQRQHSHGALNDNLRKLCIRLGPLRQVEESLIKFLSGSASIPADVSKPLRYNPARASEISIPSGTGWQKLVKFRRSSVDTGVTRAIVEKSEAAQNRRILAACCQDIVGLWNDPSVKDALKTAGITLEDQPGFFLDDAERITDEKYMPVPNDILKARVTTIGPEEHIIRAENETDKDWILYDVPGSRSHRAAWAQFFEDVNAIIFLAPISAFNQVLAEDETVNRLTDSLRIWEMICSNKVLSSIEFILFLNKLDVLDSKLKSGVQFSKYVASYVNKPNETKPVAKYLLDVFVSLHQKHSPKRRKLHPHLTCAIDTRATSAVILRIQEVIFLKILSETSIL